MHQKFSLPCVPFLKMLVQQFQKLCIPDKAPRGFCDKSWRNFSCYALDIYIRTKSFENIRKEIQIIFQTEPFKVLRVLLIFLFHPGALYYLQLMKSGEAGGNESRQVEVAAISGGLKKLAKDLQVPVLVLAQLAELFEVTVNDLVADPNVLPERTGAVQQAMGKVVERTLKRKADKRIILGLSSTLVWFVALLIYVVLSSLGIPYSWLAFFYAVPADAIEMLSLRSAWRDFRWNRALISAIMWGALLSVYMTLLILADVSVWRIFLLGIPGQVAILLWFRMFRHEGEKGNKDGQEAAAQADSGEEAGHEPEGN